MKCQKCAKNAVVHLTEVVTDKNGLGGLGPHPVKRAVEIHLCIAHAVAAGLMLPTSDVPPQVLAMQGPESERNEKKELPKAIVPVAPESAALALSREEKTADSQCCPICGMNWPLFKQVGVMGCPHDYEMFALRLLPLLKRAQEGAIEHAGKLPPRRKADAIDVQAAARRLRRELEKAVDGEKYEQAASLRDKLRQLDVK